MSGFLNTGNVTKFLGVDEPQTLVPATAVPGAAQSPAPPPIQPLQTKSKSAGTAQVDQSKLTPVTPVAAPGGPTTAPTTQGTGQFVNPSATTGATNYATKQTVAPTTTSDKVTDSKTQAPAAPAAADDTPKVAADRGVQSTDRDPVTGLVYDKTANNRAAETAAKTYVGDDGVVHYAEQNPDGSPKSPAEDKAGWAKLTPEQQKAAMTDFKTKLETYATEQNSKNGKNADGTTNYLDPDQFSQLDVNGQLAAVNHFLDPTQADPSGAKTDAAAAADKSVKQAVSTTADGVTHFTPGLDADGNLLPLDPKTLAGLTPAQLSSVKQQYATALRNQASAQAASGTAANDFMGTGMSQSDFEALPASQQADALEGIKPPVQNADGTTTQTLKAGGSETKDSTGKVVSSVAADGTATTFGTGSVKTVTSADGNTITTTDSDGNTKVTYKEGSPQDIKQKELSSVGFNPDGTQQSSFELYAAKKGFDPATATPRQKAEYQQAVAQSNQSTWSQGEAYASAAVRAGLLTQQQYTQLRNADFDHSFGAWATRNADILAAVKNSNIPVTPSVQPGLAQTRSYATPSVGMDDDYFTKLRGEQGYVDPASLQSQDYSGSPTAGMPLPGSREYDALPPEGRAKVDAMLSAGQQYDLNWARQAVSTPGHLQNQYNLDTYVTPLTGPGLTSAASPFPGSVNIPNVSFRGL